MALELDPILAAAQDAQTHRPIIEIISRNPVEDIPFLGQLLDPGSAVEQKPNVITHSSGAICGVYTYGSAFRFFYTNTDRTEFSFLDIPVPAGNTAQEATLVELASGDIGIILYCTTSANQILYRMVVSPAGAIVTAMTSIYSVATSAHVLSGPFVIRLASGTYFLVYADETVSGATYAVRKRTSSDFAVWSSEGTVSIGGLTATKRIAAPSLLQISTGDIWLWFDYLESTSGTCELTNVYYSTSSDNGGTWAAATKFTNYSTYDTVGEHPFTAQKAAGLIHLIYTEKSGALHMDKTQSGYCGSTADLKPAMLTFDSVNRKLYVVAGQPNALYCIIRVDVDTWTIDACWNSATTPALPAFYFSGAVSVCPWRNHGDGYLIPIGLNGGGLHVALLNGQVDTVTEYNFATDLGKTQNVHWTASGAVMVVNTWADATNNRLYCVLIHPTIPVLHIGYFDLTATPDPITGYYTFTDVLVETAQISLYEMEGLNPAYGDGSVQILPEEDLLIVSYAITFGGSFSGRLRIHILSTGALYKDYKTASFPEFPLLGLLRFQYLDGKIYGSFHYQSSPAGEINKRGLCILDLASDIFTYSRPTWLTVDEYNLGQMIQTSDAKLVIISAGYGMAVFDTAAGTWVLYNNDNIPGMDPEALYSYYDLAFDATNGMIFTGTNTGVYWAGLIAFSIYGLIRRSFYQVGTYFSGWTWTAKAAFTRGLIAYEAVASVSPDASHGLYAFWTYQTGAASEQIKWGKEGSTLDLGPYLSRQREITISRSIDGKPATLEFEVTHGFLFDPNNISSLLSICLRKGRNLTVRLGEKIGGVDYWQNQGSFLVTETSLTYQRKEYPVMSVTALDRRILWDQAEMSVSPYYQDYPEAIIADILDKNFDYQAGDLDLPIFANREKLYNQWIEVPVKDTIDQICNRFGYFPRMTVDDKFSAREISDANAVDHTYPDATKIIDFTPDDSFSDFTNRVTVMGHELAPVDVTYAEERIDTLNGTCGWWGFKKDFTVYYSKDGSRTCLNPRLVILESTQSILFQLAGHVHEEISYDDPNHQYCIVTITAPNLIGLLLAGIAVYTAAALIGDGWFGYGAGVTIPIGRIMERVGLILAFMVLGATGNFQFEIWAQPRGEVYRTIHATANDEDLQAEIGAVIPKKIEDPLCYSYTACSSVAEFELMVAKRQRARVNFSKVAHLQDEEGDTLSIPHPYTENATKIFVTDLTRRIKIPEKTGEESAITDQIAGWNVT